MCHSPGVKMSDYLALIQQRWRLLDWDLELDLDNEPVTTDEVEIVWAEVTIDHTTARFRFTNKFWDQEPAKQRRIVAHEVGHVMLCPLALYLATCSSNHAYNVEIEEQVNERLERALMLSLPLRKLTAG